MNLSETVDVMQGTPLFRRLDPKRLRVVAMTGETLSYLAGERIFDEGDEGEDAFVILDGVASVVLRAGEGERALSDLNKGEIFGEIAALTGDRRSTSIDAKTDLVVLRLDRNTILTLMREFPDIALEMIRILADRLRETTSELARGGAA